MTVSLLLLKIRLVWCEVCFWPILLKNSVVETVKAH